MADDKIKKFYIINTKEERRKCFTASDHIHLPISATISNRDCLPKSTLSFRSADCNAMIFIKLGALSSSESFAVTIGESSLTLGYLLDMLETYFLYISNYIVTLLGRDLLYNIALFPLCSFIWPILHIRI